MCGGVVWVCGVRGRVGVVGEAGESLSLVLSPKVWQYGSPLAKGGQILVYEFRGVEVLHILTTNFSYKPRQFVHIIPVVCQCYDVSVFPQKHVLEYMISDAIVLGPGA